MINIYFLLFTTAFVAAVPCSSTQKQQMLNVITADPQWASCKAATAPYDFYTSLTQAGPPPTAAQNDLFNSTPACTNVYNRFQDSLKQANCDQIQNLMGLPYAQFVTLTMGTPPTTAPVASSNIPIEKPNPIVTSAPSSISSSISGENDQLTQVKSTAMNHQVVTAMTIVALALLL
uniref:Secreted protein n=1 Tax=Thraustotheca clavata TaxID=74557 RepID=A0A0A7CLL5_9STRA|nr:secreted protein [Thraustotheca clavata]